MTTDEDALRVTASHVWVDRPVITGAGATTGGTGRGIAFLGTPERPLGRGMVTGGELRELPHDGVYIAYYDDFDVTGVRISRTGYSGVMTTGARNGMIQDNRIEDILQPAGRPNSYGIALGRDATRDMSIARRSSGIRVLRNHVENVRNWEGIDTHAGQDIEIRGNTVIGCRVGIAAVPSKDPADRMETLGAPRDVLIEENDVVRDLDLEPGAGIIMSGAGTTVGSTRERARGSISSNTVRGGAGSSGEGAIVVKLSEDTTVSGNTIVESIMSAIALPHSNSRIAIHDNVVEGVSGTSVGINVVHGVNDGAIIGNRFRATDPRLRVAVRFGSAPNVFTVRENEFNDAMVQVARGGATVSE
ncbi:right-handed parallel beta-helix repeat-containing protein [Curtobacterium pusillum]|uniref:Right handed beta helix domain-containing protein n=1 Tax=Curtobacterium pusillum TaxID=69373 RepID=A0ABX2M8B5_9MICO|nr:right-handed parallel beta-helix repeat-containing protein [Curtobacterium pusillum]NUU14309.1 hypothetical protein [Curtobacterium pusillum]